MSESTQSSERWYTGITRYQWMVLAIASAGWVFDVFEGQIFVASMNEAMDSLLPEEAQNLSAQERADLKFTYNNVALGAFLLGGALGGVVFGVLSDRFGRTRMMAYTILVYSLFTCVSALSQEWWHMAVFRFLVAMGVGGEWAIASALVAEVFPKKARAWSLGIFHASSVLGTYLAVLAGALIVANPSLSEGGSSLNWRMGFVVGVLPAFLILWIRWSLKEPESWQRAREISARDITKRMGNFRELFAPGVARNTIVGVGLAGIGLATFWGAHIYGKDVLRRDVELAFMQRMQEPGDSRRLQQVVEKVLDDLRLNDDYDPTQLTRMLAQQGYVTASSAEDTDLPPEYFERIKQSWLGPGFYFSSIKRWEMIGLFLTTTGGGIGLICFGPLSERWGRRGAFFFYHIGGFVSALMLFLFTSGLAAVCLMLPVFGFLTLGMHAGYAIYFPELFPTRLRGTGGGFCFNAGRILVPPILLLTSYLREGLDLTLEQTAALLALLFLVGVVLLRWAPETRGQELPE